MRFLSTAILAALAAVVCAQTETTPPDTVPTTPAPPPVGGLPNPITEPTAGSVWNAGEPNVISWTPSDDGTVTLRLRSGDDENDLDTIMDIAVDIPNTGTFEWTPTVELEGDDDYSIEIISSDGVSNYSPKFEVISDGEGIPQSSTTEAAPSTTTEEPSSSAAPTVSTMTITSNSTTTTVGGPSSTTTTRTPRPTNDDDDDDEDDTPAPDADDDSAAPSSMYSSPLALVLCVGVAIAYLS